MFQKLFALHTYPCITHAKDKQPTLDKAKI